MIAVGGQVGLLAVVHYNVKYIGFVSRIRGIFPAIKGSRNHGKANAGAIPPRGLCTIDSILGEIKAILRVGKTELGYPLDSTRHKV
jgi:hypothetical protein